MRQAPKWFVERLAVFDRNVRVRWSRERSMWAIEEKRPRNFLFTPVKMYRDVWGNIKGVLMPEYSERNIQYKDGYSVIIYVKELNENIIAQLSRMSAGALDAYRGTIIQDVEKMHRDVKNKEEVAETTLRRALAEEAYSKYKFEARRNNE